jgi:hypothetical protein
MGCVNGGGILKDLIRDEGHSKMNQGKSNSRNTDFACVVIYSERLLSGYLCNHRRDLRRKCHKNGER